MTKAKKSSFGGKVRSNTAKQQTQGSSYGYLNLPKGINMFSVDPPAKVKFDILPYIVTDPKHPDRDYENGVAIVDSQWYRRPFKVHKNVGAGNDAVVCLTSFGKKCPICEYRSKLMKEGGDQDEIKSLKPTKRSLYVIIPKEGNKKGEMYIYDASDFLFQEALNTDMEENDEFDFPDLEIGKTLQVTYTKESFAGKNFAKASRVKFLERDEAYNEDILEQVPDLDNVLQQLTYSQVEAKFLEIDEDDDDPKETETEDKRPAAKTKKSSAPKAVDDEDPDPEERTKKSAVPKADSKPAKKEPVKEEVGEEEEQMTWEDLEGMNQSKLVKLIKSEKLDVDAEDYEDSVEDLRKAIAKEMGIEVPKKALKKPVKEEEEDDAPRSKKTVKPEPASNKKERCPHDHTFGVDTDDFKECGKCKLWDECTDEKDSK